MSRDVLVFGYGSLVWKPEPGFVLIGDAFITNVARRFWQSSPDHRGTPDAPGCVVTLLRLDVARRIEERPKCVVASIIPHVDGKLWGRLFKIPAEIAPSVMRDLDFREKAGYSKFYTEAHMADGSVVRDVLVYSADEHNENFVGHRQPSEIAAHVFASRGPSGPNSEYFWRLHEAISHISDEADEHLNAIAEELRKLENANA